MTRAEEFRQLRVRASLTQARAAALLKVSSRAVQHWEAGTRRMSDTAWELARLRLQSPS